MSSLGISPTTTSLLIPPNPSFTSVDTAPRGGILLNPRRASDASAPSSPAFQSVPIDPSSPPINRKTSEPPDSPRTPISPIDITVPAFPSISSTSPSGIPKIRFAPLPDPRRPRSLSTGQDVPDTIAEDAVRTFEYRGVVNKGYDDEDALADADAGDVSEYEEDGEKKRRWSKTMTMGMGTVPGWRGTKKLLGMKEDKKEDVYTEGAPLKKSVSTGGLMGSSPFRSNAEAERKHSMQGLTAPFSSRLDMGHRRNSSLEPATTSGLSSSPQPVRMLNGRVYGSRRASEAAERQKEMQRKLEPNFVEWGNNQQAAGSGRGFLGDAEEGSGMEWVKKRREERLKKIQAEKDAATSYTDHTVDPLESPSSPSNSPDTTTNLVTPDSAASPLPPTPIIQVSEHQSPGAEKSLSMGDSSRLGTSAPGKVENPMREHVTQAIQVPRRNEQGDRDVFDDDASAISDAEDDEEEDNDFSEDEEEEEDIRTTSSAAGVEVVSRHKN